MKKNRIVAWILVLVLSVGLMMQLPISANAANNIVRDTVLVLDISGSMHGEPMETLVKAAKKFCASVLEDSGTNRVAVVSYSTRAYLDCDFTADISILETAIDNMSGNGTTNTYGALEIADNLLSASNASIKNIVLMSDGLPNAGETERDGRYTRSDYSEYYYANAVYKQAVSLHPNYYIYTLGFFHNIYGNTKAFAGRFMEDLQNAGYYEVDTVEDLEFTFGEIAEDIIEAKITGTFRYPSGGKDYSATYYYADEYFYNASTNFNQSLATMSLCLAMSAFGSSDVSSYEYKSINVQNLMEELLFTDFETTQSFKEKPMSDSIAVAVGQKKIQDNNGEVFTLIAVAIRGGGYEQEWASNFTIGNSGNHVGFSEAAQQVIDFLRQYIAEHRIEGNIKLWITGYSRAAATSNLVAGALDSGTTLGSNVNLAKEDLYAYCFETPAGTTDPDANSKIKYGNIFNIINPNDLVTKVAPTAMGFRRYGVDRVLPTKENKYSSYDAAKMAMLDKYDELESTDGYLLDAFVYEKVNILHILPGGKDIVYEAEQQMTMSAFLDEFISKFIRNYVGRNLYSTALEDGIRELCIAIFQDESKALDVMKSTTDKLKKNALGLIWKLAWDEYGAYEDVAGYLTESLKAAGAVGFDEKEIKKAAQPILDVLLAYLANNFDYLATLIDNGGYFFPAHYPELCLAWMQSFDRNYNTDAGEEFSSGSYRVIHINCPVDIKVYDPQGILVAAIEDDSAKSLEDSSIIAMINSDGEKIVYLPADADFEIEITGNGTGTVSYSVNEHSYEVGQVNRLVNYYDVPIEEGQTLRAVVPAYDNAYLSEGTENGTDTYYSLTDADGNLLTPTLDVSGTTAIDAYHTVTVESEDLTRGTVTGAGSRQTGNYARIAAIAQEGYAFEGWYTDGRKVSSDAEYRFCVTEDITLVAKFSSDTLEQVESEPLASEEIEPPAADEIVAEANNNLWIYALGGLLAILFVVGIAMVLVVDTKKKPIRNEPVLVVQEKSRVDRDVHAMGMIRVTSGSMNGFTAPIKDDETAYLGKDAKIANIVFTNDYQNVSRVHCSVTYDEKINKFFVTDCSSNGTYFITGERLVKGKRTPIAVNTILMLANDKCKISLERQGK